MIQVNVTKQLQGTDGPFELSIQADIDERSLLAITGTSGSGKTTLLRMIAGLVDPDAGEIVVDGETWFDSRKGISRKPQERRIGFVFQGYSLFPNMTVRENLSYAGNSDTVADELLEIVELEKLADRYPDTLSGGQKQRVALARALARGPEILLLDEPFTSLDPAMKTKMQEELLRIHKRYPITTVLVSHDMGEIYRLSTRMITIEKGRVAADGTPKAMLTNRTTSHKFAFTGKIVDIRKNDIVRTVLIAAGNTINEVVLTAGDAQDLCPGDDVIAATKAFQPIIRKLRHA